MLQQLQQSFLSSLATGDSEFLSHLQPLTTLSAQQTLNIYYQEIKAKALNVLKGIYQVHQEILGMELFDAIAANYYRYSPPQASDFTPFAAGFVEFVTEYCLQADCSYLAEIARLEWKIYLLLREFDSPQLDLEALAQVDADSQGEIFFHLPTGAVLLQSSYPLDEIMKANQPGYEGNSLVDVKPGEFYFIVWRSGWRICVDRLTWKEWLVLQQVHQNIRFREVCDYLAFNHSSVDITTTFPHLVARGWIASFSMINS